MCCELCLGLVVAEVVDFDASVNNNQARKMNTGLMRANVCLKLPAETFAPKTWASLNISKIQTIHVQTKPLGKLGNIRKSRQHRKIKASVCRRTLKTIGE